MKSIEELKSYYDKELMKDLLVLEEDRKKIAKKLATVNILCGLSLIIPVILFFILPSLLFIAFIALILVIILWVFFATRVTKGYKSDFKNKIIYNIIKFIDPNLEYYPENMISQQAYMASRIFPTRVDRYTGDDYVKGKIGDTFINFSEIHSEYKTQSKNGTQWHTIFKGLFFIADFNKKFKSQTLVLPDVAEKMFGSIIGKMFQDLNKARGQLVKMDDPEFEKLFVVYSNDQIDARYILSTSLMKRITDFKKNSKKNIYLSFINNQIFVAISYYKNLFEPKIFKTLIDFDLIKEYYEDMSLAIGIVEELNLNTRIWG